jgi:hypothetical protein
MECELTNTPVKKELYIGLDVHKDSITVATQGGRGGEVLGCFVPANRNPSTFLKQPMRPFATSAGREPMRSMICVGVGIGSKLCFCVTDTVITARAPGASPYAFFDAFLARTGELKDPIFSYLGERNLAPKRWKATGEEILAKIKRARECLNEIIERT